MSEFERISEEIKYDGKLIRVGVQRYRHADGKVVTREKVWHPGAVAILAVDDRHVWLVRQPREVIGEGASLEVPAGKMDVAGEDPLATAQRELEEEIGKRAGRWRAIKDFYTSAGFSDERMLLYLAQDLSDLDGPPAGVEDERIEIVPWPLERLDAAIDECEDAKSLVALQWLALATRA